jgi:hypothetical protein
MKNIVTNSLGRRSFGRIRRYSGKLEMALGEMVL